MRKRIGITASIGLGHAATTGWLQKAKCESMKDV